MLSMKTVPAQPLENSAVMITTPGVMNSRYEPDAGEKPGMCTTLRNNCPNSNSQMTGCTSVIAAYAGWRNRVRTAEAVSRPECRTSPPATLTSRALLEGPFSNGGEVKV